MTARVLLVAIAAEPILRGGCAAVVTDDETGETWVRIVRNTDQLPEPGPPAVEAYREQRRRGVCP